MKTGRCKIFDEIYSRKYHLSLMTSNSDFKNNLPLMENNKIKPDASINSYFYSISDVNVNSRDIFSRPRQVNSDSDIYLKEYF